MKERKTVDTTRSVKQALSSETNLRPSTKAPQSPSPTWVPNTAVPDMLYQELMGWTDTLRIFGLEHPKANTVVCLKKFFSLSPLPPLTEVISAQKLAVLVDLAW